eukprot:9177764-Pyramimonas_sp.AAC.1
MRVVVAYEARGGHGGVGPVQLNYPRGVHRRGNCRACAWDYGDVVQFSKHGVHEKVEARVCWAVAGEGPVGARWIDMSKGDANSPDRISMLVAQHVHRNSKGEAHPQLHLCYRLRNYCFQWQWQGGSD